VAVVLDAGGDCRKAKRLLRQKRPELIIMDCIAHQINLLTGDLFKFDSQLKVIAGKALNIVNWWNNHSFANAHLKTKQLALYGKTIALTTPAETRWASHGKTYASLLKSSQALKALTVEMNAELLERSGNRTSDKQKALHVLGLIDDRAFWSQLQVLSTFMEPLTVANLILQKNDTTLADALETFGRLMKSFKSFSPEYADVGKKIVEKLEARWLIMDQPLFILCYILDPEKRRQNFSTGEMSVSWVFLVRVVNDIYKRLFEKDPTTLLDEFMRYRSSQFPFDDNDATTTMPPKQFGSLLQRFVQSRRRSL
jgi:hypothetical protein